MVVGRGYKSRVVGVGNGLKIKEKREKSLPRKKSVLKTLKEKDITFWGKSPGDEVVQSVDRVRQNAS